MTLEELLAGPGWGLHDALLVGVEIDWVKAELRLDTRIKVDKDQKLDRRATVTITGLQYCVVDPPAYEDAVEKTLGRGLWIDDGPGSAPGQERQLPATPDGFFAHWIFVREWNSFIYLCGREATLEWTEREPTPVPDPNLYWPGDEVPDSE